MQMGPVTQQWEVSDYEQTGFYTNNDARVQSVPLDLAISPSVSTSRLARSPISPTAVQMRPLTQQWEASGYEQTGFNNNPDFRVGSPQPLPFDYPLDR